MILAQNKDVYFGNEAVLFAFAAANNKDKAIEFLEKANEERDPSLVTIKMWPVYGFLNNEQRFVSLIKKIGLPE